MQAISSEALNNTKFTVLMSLYYKENPVYLNDCLRSIYEQSIAADEIVIVYDGVISQELSFIVNKWVNRLPIVIAKLPINKGLGYALNFGIKFCSHDIIARMDTDDFCIKERFEIQLGFIIAHPELSVVGGAIEEFDENMKFRLGKRFIAEKHVDIVNAAVKKNPMNHMSVMYRKEDVIASGGYQEHLFFEDYNLWLRMIYNGCQFYNLPQTLVNVRSGKNMIQRRKGISYIKGEVQLFNLKIALGFGEGIVPYVIFVMRALPRLMPSVILQKIYKHLRT